MSTVTTTKHPTTADRVEAFVQEIAQIRVFEQTLLQMFSDGELFGTTHTCIGQEVGIVALYKHLERQRDAVFTNHRCHGHYLAFGGEPESLLAEIMGKEGALCGGRGGSQHLCDNTFFSQGIQAGSMPIAAGYAWMLKQRGQGGIAVVHIGDGTLGEGLVYEALNMISLRKVPTLVVLENNGVAQSTATDRTTAGSIEERFTAFGLPVHRHATDDPDTLAAQIAPIVESVRAGNPAVLILDTFRLMAHSKGDDDRPEEVVQAAWERDYLHRQLQQPDSNARKAMEKAQQEMDALVAKLKAAPYASVGDTSCFAEPPSPLLSSSQDLVPAADSGGTLGTQRIATELGTGIADALEADEHLLLIGEDIADPYGGAFKVSRGLSTRFGHRVFSTPISEAAIVGFANGVALAGGRSIAEIMFGDFATLAVDQIINQAAKTFFMYAGKAHVPTTIRLPSGGYRGYGPTHSQSLERIFCGVPGLKVVALSRRHDARELLAATTIRDPNPVVLVENKSLYAKKSHTRPPLGFRFHALVPNDQQSYPPLAYSTVEGAETADVTVVTYGGMTDMVEAAMEELILSDEIEFDYFVLTQLSPLDTRPLQDSLARTGRLVTIEEGTGEYGIGAEIVAQCSDQTSRALRVHRVAAQALPIPGSRIQEDLALPSVPDIVKAIRETLAIRKEST